MVTSQPGTSRVDDRVGGTGGPGDGMLTGAEAVGAILAEHGVETVFAYPGTSELALCDAVAGSPHLRLVNGRGDKEAAFLATGASLLRPNRGVAVLHGARGLTNAGGPVAVARRNEVGTVFFVGLASTGSAEFLPPHGEPGLISAVGHFTGWSWEAPAVPRDDGARVAAADAFVAAVRTALDRSSRLPAGPSLVGIPQDVADQRWIPAAALAATRNSFEPTPLPAAATLEQAVAELYGATRPVFLVDDYALRFPAVAPALAELTRLVGAPVFQLRYRRGPMLFERLRHHDLDTFLGWLNQFSPAHSELLAKADLLVTVEDRNIYQRVVGELPPCRKIAVNSTAGKARKNGYLAADDLVVEGDVTAALGALAAALRQARVARSPWYPIPDRAAARVTPEPATDAVVQARTGVVQELADMLAQWPRPVLVDDSQMFGGLISEHYDLLPDGLRVFGCHGGFVGGGLATATGLAIGSPENRVLCTMGDQAFTNSLQGLACAVQERADIVFLVCNNGESVSLNKQAAAGGTGQRRRSYLDNVSGLSYPRLAEAFGVPAWSVRVTPGENLPAGLAALREALDAAQRVPGPAFVELVLPADPGFWRGIWLTCGFDQAGAASEAAR